MGAPRALLTSKSGPGGGPPSQNTPKITLAPQKILQNGAKGRFGDLGELQSFRDISSISALTLLEKTRALARVSATFARKSDALARCVARKLCSR